MHGPPPACTRVQCTAVVDGWGADYLHTTLPYLPSTVYTRHTEQRNIAPSITVLSLVQDKQIDDVDNKPSGRIGAPRAPAFAGTDC